MTDYIWQFNLSTNLILYIKGNKCKLANYQSRMSQETWATWYVRIWYKLQAFKNEYVTRSRKMSHLSKISISIFLHHFLITWKCFILIQTPLQLEIWLQSYEEFVNAKNDIKQRNLNTVFANISTTTLPTSDSFLLIMSHSVCLRLGSS